MLERVRGLAHARCSPDEDDVERREADETHAHRPGRRDQRDRRGGREACERDQRGAGRVPEEAACQPGREPEPGSDRRPEPPVPAALADPACGGEDGRAEGSDQRESVRALWDEIDHRHAHPEQRGGNGEPYPASSQRPRLPCWSRSRRGLRGAEHRVRRDEGERQLASEASSGGPGTSGRLRMPSRV